MQGIAWAAVVLGLLAVFAAGPPSSGPSPEPFRPVDEILPLLPPGISDSNVEIYGRLAYTWTSPDNVDIVEVRGDFSLRLGQHKLDANDGVVWFTRRRWQDRPYLDMEVFLWQDAAILQPGGTIERGPALIVTLRSFGSLLLNVDSHAAVSDADSDLYREATKAHALLDVSPPANAETAPTPVVVSPTPEQLLAARPKPPKIVQFSVDRQRGQLIHEQHGDQSVVIAIGDVIVSQGSPAESGEYLELHADAAVLYLKSEKLDDAAFGALGRDRKPKARPASGQSVETPPDEAALESEPEPLQEDQGAREAAREWVSSVYLEGDVVLTRGQRMIRASKLLYDFDNDRALILDAVMRAFEPSQRMPIYVRAEEVRQLTATEFEAKKAQITTSEFYTPHVSIGAEKVYLQDRTPRNERDEVVGVEAGTYKAYNTTLNVEGVPVAYWPFSRGDFSRDRMAFRGARVGYESDFGAVFETRWYLFNLLGLQQPEGYDATLKMDYFTDRGPATGIDLDYEQEDYMGLFRSYYVYDKGDDDLGGGRGGTPDTDQRGRVLWRHRQFLPQDWELSLEGAYISDDNFLESYERNEWENGKDQETAIYLVKRRDNWQFSTLANWRINEFLTQTEHLPESMFSLIGEPLGDVATLYSESRAGVVRYRHDNRRDFNEDSERWWDNTGSTGSVVRGDTRDELQFPLPALGPLKVTPYVMGRAGGWDDTPDSTGGGGAGRYLASYGVQSNMIFSKVDDTVESELLDLHRLRHVIKTDATVWNAHSNKDPLDLTPFDPGVEDVADFGGGTVGVRQRWQTQRGGPGRWRSVDWIVFDVEAGFFNNSEPDENTHGDFIYSRPEDSISSNFLAMNFQYRISDSTVVVYDGVYDWNNGNVGTSNVSLAVEREPRLGYFVGWRYIHDTNNSLLGGGANYKLNEKHTVGIREYYDLDRGRNYTTELVYIRKWPRWYTAIAFDIDRSLDDVGVNLSVWPEGAPQLGIGSKRYTGLADSVGIRP